MGRANPSPFMSKREGRRCALHSQSTKMAGAPFAPAMPFPFVLKMAREGVDPLGSLSGHVTVIITCQKEGEEVVLAARSHQK